MKPTLLFHVQHFLGIGHLVRAFALADGLADNFEVVIVSGGRFPDGIEIPGNVTIAQLPALGVDKDRSTLVSHEAGLTVQTVLCERVHQLIQIYEATQPDVLLVELFPFGRKKLAGELIPLLERAHANDRKPLVACSVRDLLITGRHDQQRHDDRASSTANQFFDLIMVHGDRDFATLEESFAPNWPLKIPVQYTGFVAPPEPKRVDNTEIPPNTVVVSAGGGWVGQALMRAGLEAAPIIHKRHGLNTTLVAGPLADYDNTNQLETLALEDRSVSVVRSVPGLLPTLRQAAVSVSQAGYNTVLDILRAEVPSVLVPYGDMSENEQPRRAERLAHHGAATVVDPLIANGETLADAVSFELNKPRRSPTWNLDGAHTSSSLLHDALTARRSMVAI